MNISALKNIVDRQIEHNKGKNLLYVDAGKTLQFSDQTMDQLEHFNDINREDETLLIDYATEKTVMECCRINQYFSFNQQSVSALKYIFKALLINMKNKEKPAGEIAVNHYNRLRLWLQTSNPYVKSVYAPNLVNIQPVPCAEYEAALQIKILHLNVHQSAEPVLDIGCGKEAKLATAFQLAGYQTFGIDRFASALDNIIKADWLEFDYGVKKWGTIMSHLGFSNHFNHHHLKEDGIFILYARKYMEILESLKLGGSFHYSPGLPFIENYLDRNRFAIIKYSVDNLGFKTTVITRLG